jgi:hypothetical protein
MAAITTLPYTQYGASRLMQCAKRKARSPTCVAVGPLRGSLTLPRPGFGTYLAPIMPILHHGAACAGGVPLKVGLLNKQHTVSTILQDLPFDQLKQ